MPLAKFYMAGKHNPSARSRIGFMYLDESISGVNLAAVLNAFEAMSNGGETEDATHPRIKIYGASIAKVDTKAALNVIEGNDLTANPMGVDGYAFADLTGLPVGIDVRQPLTIKGINPNFTLPSGYDDGPIDKVVGQFVTKWAKARYVNNGALTGRTITTFNVVHVYRLH